MRLIPRPPDSPEALNRYLETVGHTISDEAEALEQLLGARIPAPGQQREAWGLVEAGGEEDLSPPSLHTHRPLLRRTRFEAHQRFADDDDEEQDRSELAAEESALPSPRHMLDGDGVAEVEWAQQQAEWEQGEAGTPRSVASSGNGMDLETATRLNSELQQQLASQNTAATAARLAGVVVNSVDDSQGEASWAQLLRADSRNSHGHGTPTREMIPAWSPPAGSERSTDAERAMEAARSVDAERSIQTIHGERSMMNVSVGSYYDVRPPEGPGVPQELLDLRQALTVANAARRAAEKTMQSVISGEPPMGYTLGRGAQPRRVQGGVEGLDEEGPGSTRSSVQLHEAVRLRWAERQVGGRR